MSNYPAWSLYQWLEHVPLATPEMVLMGLLIIAGPSLASSWPPSIASFFAGPAITTIGDQEDPDVMTTILNQVTSKL